MDSMSHSRTCGTLLMLSSAVAFCGVVDVHAQSATDSLSRYYHAWSFGDVTSTIRSREETVPRLQITGGGPDPVRGVNTPGGLQFVLIDAPYPVTALLVVGNSSDSKLTIGNYRDGSCNSPFSASRTAGVGATTTHVPNLWTKDLDPATALARVGYCPGFDPQPAGVPQLWGADEATYGAPVRRTAIDGSQYNASPLQHKRNGLPWYTYYFGYRLGLVANESNWDNANLSRAGDMVGVFTFPSAVNNFNLAKLPPPLVEDDVVEYVNRVQFPNQPDGQFFYTALPHEKALLDSVPVWQRSGNTFKSGGYVSACRFYGGKNGGPNTHFYSADDQECALLKQVSFLEYEGQSFAVNMPMPARNADQQAYGALRDCPIDSKPLYRLYNNASSSGGRFVSNHRYITARADVNAAVAQGWRDEGHVMCVPN